MKFEESSLTGYLVKNLQPLTEADPVILAEYVAALLKKDKPIKELQKLCAEKLVEFLGQGTNSFITNLFQALEDGSVVAPAKSLDTPGQVEPSPPLITEDPVELKGSVLNSEVLSPGCASDPEEKEVSDDDDDDRNHKHRRRETRSQSFDKDVRGQFLRRTNKKRNNPFENGDVFFGNDPQSSENQKEYNPASSDRDLSAKIDKRRVAPLPRTGYDLGLRTRLNQAFHGDPGPHLDLPTSLSRLPTGRGRGRGSGPWNQHDFKFSSMDALDFASQMPPQGPTPNGLFAGMGLQTFGMIPGIPNGGLDTLHPLGLQGALGPQINQSMSMGMPRQRCRDFEERGFCLRGDMCPMEHGINRIVIEDVQSLSQFNLPVSLPSAHLLGTSAGAGSLHLGGGPSSLLANPKFLHTKNNKHGIGDDGFGSNKVSSASAGSGEADLYDPDQPLWNNTHLSSPKVDAEPLWNGVPSDGCDGELSGRSVASAVGSQSTSSSVWGRIKNSGHKLDATGNFDTTKPSMGTHRKETKDELESRVPGTATHQRKQFASEDAASKAPSFAANPRQRNETTHNNGRTTLKALRTLFVNGVPLENNKRETLLSHFQKFGKVIDIYIPLNSEKAFVQFSKREEAEAALKAPDAVMGNRFIRLWWANRDSIPDNSLSVGDTVSAPPPVVGASVMPQTSVVDRGKQSLSSAVPKVSAAPSDVPMSTVAFPLVANGPKVASVPQKKLGNLEQLKEELRLKQEMLDKKRNDFRRQLDRLEKQAITNKGVATAEKATKRHKVGMGTDLSKSVASNPISSVTAGHLPGAEKIVEKNHSAEKNMSPSSKMNSSMVLQSPKSLKHSTRASLSLGTPAANRFKLDNRSTTFRVLPPLPADFADVAILKEHFSTYGDIFAVELEGIEADTGGVCSEPSGSLSARITFTTRREAETAFSNGKCWKGHNLKCSWVVVNSISTKSGRENSPTTPKGHPDAEISTDSTASGSLSVTGGSTTSVSHVAASIENGEPEKSNGTDATERMDPLEMCHSGRSPLSSYKKSSPKADTPIIEDGIDVKIVR
ncbi:Zinc finger ccch domain-containing protein [Thalictrum thalictroides]|uniref:Zinc finger ccch domain-containing protein n=1 Tax=Thalictrum thalictroides TaxID=46969 RepID=A0A7J6V2J6_THATH|nr:Zinc finger ccch domain-containing protein [Thalictrum thalictroides]